MKGLRLKHWHNLPGGRFFGVRRWSGRYEGQPKAWYFIVWAGTNMLCLSRNCAA